MTEMNTKSILKNLKQVDAPMNFSTQVYYKWEQQSKTARTLFFWKALASSSLGLLAIAVGFIVLTSKDTQPENLPIAQINKPYILYLENTTGEAFENVNAEIQLPEGVSFASSNPKVNTLKNLRLNLESLDVNNTRLPFVVQAAAPGIKEITIKVLKDNKNVLERKIRINFSETRMSQGEII